ncbi:peptide-N4-(N-acetyl-beta-glucosaminyl)asparagineamidase A, partial [Blumeria hordei DH14]
MLGINSDNAFLLLLVLENLAACENVQRKSTLSFLMTVMADNNNTIAGQHSHPTVTSVSEALERARNCAECAQDNAVVDFLESALHTIWAKIQSQPNSYVMSRDEFAIFNYFQSRFQGQQIAIDARKRFWDINSKFIITDSMASTVQSSGLQACGKNSSKAPWENPKGTNRWRGSSPTSASEKLKDTYHWLENGPRNPICLILALSALLGCLFWPTSNLLAIASNRQIEERQLITPGALLKSSPSTEKAPLNVFQVYMPVIAPDSANEGVDITDGSHQTQPNSCQVMLMNHSFGNSYGSPFVGDYTPPPCKFNRVIMNFTATSRGRQFDRLAVMYFNDTEIWRTSTAEPTTNGIIFEYTKDMTAYLSLWSKPQK